jgi:hypothetical protein
VVVAATVVVAVHVVDDFPAAVVVGPVGEDLGRRGTTSTPDLHLDVRVGADVVQPAGRPTDPPFDATTTYRPSPSAPYTNAATRVWPVRAPLVRNSSVGNFPRFWPTRPSVRSYSHWWVFRATRSKLSVRPAIRSHLTRSRPGTARTTQARPCRRPLLPASAVAGRRADVCTAGGHQPPAVTARKRW